MADVTLSYKGDDILELSNSGSATLKTGGTYCEADIEVEYVKPSGGGGEWTTDGIANGTEPSGNIVITTPNIKQEAFRYCSNVGKIDIKSATTIPINAFRDCSVTEIVSLSLQRTGSYSIGYCSSLSVCTIPKCNYLESSTFANDSELLTVDCTPTQINRGNVFNNCSKLQNLIVRTATLCSLGNTNNFTNTPFMGYNSLSGTLYVPSALVEDYKTATNWSTLYGNGTMQILPIEGSYYETHYADGTVIS